MKVFFIFLIGVFGIILIWSFRGDFAVPATENEPIASFTHTTSRVGYFHGGRSNMLYRAYLAGYFRDEFLNVEFYTKNLNEKKFFKIPENEILAQELAKDYNFGKVSGQEIIDEIVHGRLDGGVVGESSFISGITKGLPIIAVAGLGYTASPARAILVRNDLTIQSPDDFKGKTLIARRAGPGDGVLLKEFIEHIGLRPNIDVKIIEGVSDDQSMMMIGSGSIDGGLYHLLAAKALIESGAAKLYRVADWVDPEISQALLVFHKDFVINYPYAVQKVVDAYVRRIQYEAMLPNEQKDASWDKGLMMEGEFEGMEIPHYDIPPKLKGESLVAVQDLLMKHREIEKKENIENYLDYSFVEEAMKNINK